MDILKPWLAANIEGELSEALRHREDGTNRHQSIGKSEGRSYDDGSNLRIPSTRKLSIVQITKFLTFEEPIQVTLSDSVIRVNASITNQASQRYAKKNKRKLTEGTVGGLIQLLEFEIVATHLGPRDKRLTLYVKDFKSLGSNGSGNFGVAPQAIESREGTKKLLNKLADLRRHGPDAHVQQSTTASPIKSQPSTQTSQAGNNQNSQVGFATQAPRSNAPIISKPKPPDPTTSINIGSTSTANSAKSLAPPTKGKPWNPLASTLSPLQLQAAPQRPGVSDKEALLGLLRNHKRAPQAPEIILEPTTGQSPGSTTASIEPTVIGRENDASLDITLASGDDKTSRAPIGTQKRKRQSPINTPIRKIANENDLHGVDKVHESLAVSHDLDSKERSGAAVTEASINTINSQPASSSISESTNLHSNAPLESSVHSISKSTSSASGQNTGRNQISSRDVKIPKDQETLLSRADSWLPAEPGQREPTTNIPISLLKTLNRKADLRAQRPTKIRKQRNGTMTPRAVIDQTVDSESDVPVSSGQWPESPERDKLPPDSSLESAEHSDHSVHRTLNTPRLLLSSRRQSRVSISSHSMLSRRPSPISTRDFPIESGSLDVASWNVVDCGADNESNSVEVSASMRPLFDRELRTPRDAEVVGQRSSTNSVLKGNMPPDAQPALAQSPTTNPDETYIAKESFLPLLPASPTPESDLEMTVPLALDEKTDSIASNAPMRHFPSTASQPQDSFTQVKRTPYVNSRAHNKSLSGSRTLSSPMKANSYPHTNGVINDETEFVSASVPSAPETSTAEIHREIGSADAIEHQGIEKVAARLAEESNSQQVTDSILEKTDRLIAEVQRERRKAAAMAVPDKPGDSSLVMTENQRQNSGLNQPFVETKANAKTQAIPETLSTSEDDHIDPLPQFPAFDHANHIAHEMKRKVADSSFVSPSVAKRQKRFKVPSAFSFAEKTEIPRDPSEGARQIRQDFLASRRSSESSTPTISPSMSLTFLTGTKSENQRDPLERARQTRQEFLASRRTSETSTPTMSPTLPFTTLLGTIQSERRDVEVEKNVGKLAAQNQLICTEIEREKMTELEELSARSQKQATKLDAAPLPNGTTSIEPDGEHAKLGAQFNSSFEYKAGSLVSVAQNTNVEGPHAGQSTMIEASSHAFDDEAQRSLSVELDVSFQSPDHQETENDLAHASDDGDQTTNPGIDLMASRDQLANTNEDGRPVNSDLDKARNDLPARADKVAKQRSTASTPEVILNQVAEPDTTALEPVHQQRSIEENTETQISDKTASEPTPQQHSLTGDVDTPLPDEIATEHTSQQLLIRADTEIPTPDVQVDQNILPLNLVAHMGEPMNQTKPPSFAVAAIVAESNAENQFRLSSAAVEPTIPLSNPNSDSEVNPIGEHQNAVQLPAEITKQKPPFVPQDIFDKFKATYPAYPGDLKHFTAICRKISQLVKANRMEHQSLWDDFIVRHKIDYPQYLRRCAEEAEDAVPYEDFYQNEIEGPQYQKRVINRRNLNETLALVAQKPIVEKVYVEPVKDNAPRIKPVENKSAPASDLVIEKIYYGHTSANGDEPVQLVGTSSTPKPATSIETFRKPSESQVTIDLRAERLHSDAIKDDGPQFEPINAKAASLEATSTGMVQKTSESRITIDLTEDDLPDYTPLAMRGSHAPPLSHSMGSPFAPSTASTASGTKSIWRSLPWKESNHSVFQSSPNATASDSPKRNPGSELREIRAKGSSNAILLPAKSTPNGSKQYQGLLNTCHRVIQSNWGLKVHELLEPEYCRGQVLSKTMIELLAEIASKVNVREARNRIKAAIDTRIGDNAWRRAGHPSRDRKMLKSDLEVVRGVVETSSMSTTSPFSLPHTNAAVEKQNEGTPLKWWDDDNSPFKSFARAYTSIRHGNGNSFAQADSAEPGDAERVSGAASSGVQLKKIDIMRWNL